MGKSGARGQDIEPAAGSDATGHGWPGLEPTAVRPVQELGTIEAGSKEVTTASDDAGRSPARSNSIRRSKALERING